MNPKEFSRVARFCSEKVEAIADPDGFVPIHKLVPAFHAELESRPLLVEAMIARPRKRLSGEDSPRTTNWKVLVNEEKYQYTKAEFQNERSQKPLPARLRFTIAHELAHSLSFRADEFGFGLVARENSGRSRKSFVQGLESDANRLSPILLVSEKALSRECEAHSSGFSVAQLSLFRKRLGVSRQAFVARLNLLDILDSFQVLSKKCLKDIAIGVGEWRSENECILLEWPIFAKFEQNLIPEMIIRLKNQTFGSMKDHFPDPHFVYNGGDSFETEADIAFGTVAHPRAESKLGVLAIERVQALAGRRFLFVLRAK